MKAKCDGLSKARRYERVSNCRRLNDRAPSTS